LEHLAGSLTSVEASRVHFGLSYLSMSRHRMEVAADHAGTALKIAEAIGDMRGMADGYKMLSHLSDYSGDLPASTEYAERSLALYRQLGDLARIPIACNNLADSLRQEGRLDQALAEMEDGLRVARQIGDTRDEALLLITTGEVLIDQGKATAAIPLLEQALALSQASGVTARIIPAQHALGVACREAGRLDDARHHLLLAASAARESGHQRYLPWIHLDLARLETAGDDFEAATGQLELAEAAAEGSASDLLSALTENCRAAVNMARREWDQAIARLETSLGYLKGAGHKVETARTDLTLARAYASRNQAGDHLLACRHLHDALAAFQALGAPEVVARVQIEMDTLRCQP
jgi:tetratricopeptide (TPR) repeat protein